MEQISIVSESEALDLFKQHFGQETRKRRMYGFYSTIFNKIIVDEHLMLIPIDERMAVRAHAVFDVFYVKKLGCINLDAHVKRLLKSSAAVGIVSPVDEKQIKSIVHEVLSQVFKRMIQNNTSK